MIGQLVAKKAFLESNAEFIAGISSEWAKLFGGEEHLSSYFDLKNATAKMRADSLALQEDIDDLELEGPELTDALKLSLIRRTGKQITERNISVPVNFHRGHTDMKKNVTDRISEPRMWVVCYDWKTAPRSGGWNSAYISSKNTHASFLCGRSDGQDWVVRVPGTITSVKGALDWITPAAVKKAQLAGQQVFRQGDMYFISLKLYNHDMEAIRRGSRHTHTGGYWPEGTTPITVSHPQHPEVKLPGLKGGLAWRAIQQKQLANSNARVGAD